MKHTSIYTWIVSLSSSGIVLASYLFFEYISDEPLNLCTFSETINCDPVTKGALSELFGIPVALIGLVGYIVILFSALAKQKHVLLGMTAFGMLFCLRLTFLEIFYEHIICPVCIACQLVMLTICILTLKIYWTLRKEKLLEEK